MYKRNKSYSEAWGNPLCSVSSLLILFPLHLFFFCCFSTLFYTDLFSLEFGCFWQEHSQARIYIRRDDSRELETDGRVYPPDLQSSGVSEPTAEASSREPHICKKYVSLSLISLKRVTTPTVEAKPSSFAHKHAHCPATQFRSSKQGVGGLTWSMALTVG